MWEVLVKLIDADKLGGWVRAGVAAILGAASGWFGGKLAPFLTSEMQASLGVVVTTIVVGFWSHLTKTLKPPTP